MKQPGYSASLGVLAWPESNHITYMPGATPRNDEAVVDGKEQRGISFTPQEDLQLHCLVEDSDVARYIAEFRSRYSDNDGGDNDGSDEPATESGGPSDTGIETLTSKYMEEMTMCACSESLLNQL
jgi:hypothetical protein